jgi:hypothetical protein
LAAGPEQRDNAAMPASSDPTPSLFSGLGSGDPLEAAEGGTARRAGGPLGAALLSWLYAYYCYDYAWALEGWPLDERIAFFEARWPFFMGAPACACPWARRQVFVCCWCVSCSPIIY